MDLANLLADTLTARGYEVEEAPPLEGKSGATYAATLVATRDGKRFLVDVLASKPVDGSDLEALQSVVDDTAVDGALLLALGDEAREVGAPHEGVEVWPRPRVARAVGDRLLEVELDESAEAIGPSPDPASAPDDEPAAATRPDTTPGPAAPATADDGAELLGSGTGSTPQPPEQEPARAQGEASADPGEVPAAQAEASTQGSESAHSSDPSPSTGETGPEPEPTPDPQPEPKAEPEPAAASEGGDPAATGSKGASSAPSSEPPAASEGPDEFLSPEEMAERAAQMAEGGGPEDGDAELLTDDDPTPEPASQQPAQGEASPAPSAQEPAQQGGSQPTQPDPDAASETPRNHPDAGGQAEPAEAAEDEPDLEGATVFEDADAALLPSEPTRPAETQETPAQETATDAQPDPSTSPQEPSSTGTGQAASGGPLAAAAPVEDEDETFLSGGCVAPRVGEQEARHEAEGAVFEVDEVRLELLPFHVFDYACRLEGDGTTRQDEGRVWVSAQSGAVVNAPKGDLVEDPGVPNERFKGSVPADRAVHQAKDHLLDNLERREELREDHSETAVIERVTLSPQAETLSLDLVGKAYAPRWRVEGQNGTVFVDAISGDLVPA